MARRANHHPMGYGERLAVVEDRLETLTAEFVEFGQKLDKLLQLGVDRHQAVEDLKRSVDGLKAGHRQLKADTEFIRASMTFARVVRRLVIWGVPIVGAVVWITERFDLIAKLFRRG